MEIIDYQIIEIHYHDLEMHNKEYISEIADYKVLIIDYGGYNYFFYYKYPYCYSF